MLEARHQGLDHHFDPGLETPAIAFWEHSKDCATVRTSKTLEEDSGNKTNEKSDHKAVTPNFFRAAGAYWTIPVEILALCGNLRHGHVSGY
jgi:hypothetical protein